jgi:hypothetical protein
MTVARPGIVQRSAAGATSGAALLDISADSTMSHLASR